MNRREHGQILIITAMALIVLIGTTALVVDVGFSWMLRRQEQNAADPGAIAASRWLKDPSGNPSWSQPGAEGDACSYAQENGFFVNDPGCASALAADDLVVVSPPTSGPHSGQPGHVQVTIRQSHPTFFGRIFGQSSQTVTTSAVAANTAGNANGASLVALQPECSAGAAGQIDGGGTVRIFPVTAGTTGGYVQVNSPCGSPPDDVCQNGSGASALSISGTLIAPHTSTVGLCVYNGSPGFACPSGVTNCLDEGALPLGDPLAFLPEPQLSDFPDGVCPDGSISTPASTSPCDLKASACPVVSGVNTCILPPGVYYGGWDVKSNVKVQLDDGMYILAGGGIKLSGSSFITSVDDGTGVAARVTIFSTDGPGCPSIGAQCQDAVKFTANQAFQVKATNTASCQAILAAGGPNTCPWRGILMWQDGTASNPTKTVSLGGQSSTILSGTIYAPLAEVDVAGGSATTGCGGSTAGCLSIQIISYRWKISGGGVVDMPYDPNELYQPEHRGLVY